MIVVPWGDTGCPHRRAAWSHVRHWWGTDLLVATCPPGPFSIAVALNRGILQATDDVLLLTGADVLLDPAAVTEALEIASTGRWVMVADEYARLNPADTATVLEGGPIPGGGDRMATAVGWGPIAAPRDLLLDVGYDERFHGWGGEDDAFGITATTLHGPPVRVGSTAWLLWHPPNPNPSYQANLDLLDRYRAAYTNVPAIRALQAERPVRHCGFVDRGMRCRLQDGHPSTHLVRAEAR